MDFFTRFTREKTPQDNFSSQNFSVENNYSLEKCTYYILPIKAGFIAKIFSLHQLEFLEISDIIFFLQIHSSAMAQLMRPNMIGRSDLAFFPSLLTPVEFLNKMHIFINIDFSRMIAYNR